MKTLVALLAVLLTSFTSPAITFLPSSTVHRHETKDVTVYITRTGDKYHRGSCSYLKRSKISVSKREAIESGYTACSVCRP